MWSYMKIFALRGAIQLEQDTSQEMEGAVARLIDELLTRNGLSVRRLIHATFSQTSDLSSSNPATALRRHGIDEVPLFCVQEPSYPNSLPRTLRVLLLCRAPFWSRAFWMKQKHCYLGGARALRPDLATAAPENESVGK
jgi:chorismate mutase